MSKLPYKEFFKNKTNETPQSEMNYKRSKLRMYDVGMNGHDN